MFCTKCGSQIAPGNKFCTVCGNPVYADAADATGKTQILNESYTAAEESYEAPPEENPETVYAPAKIEPACPPRPPKKKLSGGKIAAIIISLILAAIIGLGVTGFILVETESRKVVDYLDEGEYKKAKNLYNDKVKDNMLLNAVCRKMLDKQFDTKSKDFVEGKMKYDEAIEYFSAILKMKVYDKDEITERIIDTICARCAELDKGNMSDEAREEYNALIEFGEDKLEGFDRSCMTEPKPVEPTSGPLESPTPITTPNVTDADHPCRLADAANLLTNDEKAELVAMLNELSLEKQVDIVIVTADSLDGKTPEAYADDYFDYNGYGLGENRDGILFLRSLDPKYVHISTCGTCIKYFSDAKLNSIFDAIEHDIRSDNYMAAFKTFLSYCRQILNFESAEPLTYKVAMITDYSDITDESFNQTTYEACKEFCVANNIEFKYYKPAGDNTAERVAQVETAIDEGFNVIVMPGFAFAGTVYKVQDNEEYKNVKFIALDVSRFDVEDQFYNHKNFARTTLIDENNKPHLSPNVYCCVYKEELCSYMAGYAAVKLGYTRLGFLGGMAVPAVVRYGYGFVQGCDAAAVEMGIADQVTVEYIYGNRFFGSPEITAVMDTWYQQKQVEVVFACGGGIYASAVEAAGKVEGAKIIGVEVDQSAAINRLAGGKAITVTSAMKGLAATVKAKLQTVLDGKWDEIGGTYESLGLVSGDDPLLNYAQIPLDTTQWADGFTWDDYKALIKKMFDGTVTVDDGIDYMPATAITVNIYESIM